MSAQPAYCEIAASWHTPPAATPASFGSIILLMGAKAFAPPATPCGAMASRTKSFLILLVAGLCCLPLPGAIPTDRTNNIEFAKSLPKPGSFQWETNHRLNQERQESRRQRVAIPAAAAGQFVPLDSRAALINGQKNPPAPTPPSAIAPGNLLNLFLFAASVLLTGVLLARKFAPQMLDDLNQRFNPWARDPMVERVYPAQVLEEEKSFDEFIGALRIWAAASAPAGVTGPDGPPPGFYPQAKKRLVRQRHLLQSIEREWSDPALKKSLVELGYELGALKDEAGFPAALPVWQVASALEGLVRQLAGKIRSANPSTLRAIGGGLDLLDQLCVPGMPPDLLTDRPLKFLVVDDDQIARHALSLALKKAFGEPDLAVDGEAALAQAARQAYDVIFLDVQLPGMDGFELCAKIRGTDFNRTTPVIFVTGHSDFNARARSVLSGGNDLMGKPFLIFEVTVKALTLAWQARLQADHQPPLIRSVTAPAHISSR